MPMNTWVVTPTAISLSVPASPYKNWDTANPPLTNGNGFCSGIIRLSGGTEDPSGPTDLGVWKATLGWRPKMPVATKTGRILPIWFDRIGRDVSDDISTTYPPETAGVMPDFALLKDVGAHNGVAEQPLNPSFYYYFYLTRPDYPQSVPLLAGREYAMPSTDLNLGYEIVIMHEWEPDPSPVYNRTPVEVDIQFLYGVLT